MQEWTSQFRFLNNLSEETRKGMQEKAEEGEFPAYAPLGYLSDKTQKFIEKGHRVARSSVAQILKNPFIFGILSSYFSHAAGRPIQAAMVSSHQTFGQFPVWRVC